MAVAVPDTDITFLGFAEGAEILGAIQADFGVDLPNGRTKELSVLLNEPAAAYLAERLGMEPSETFRESAAKASGVAWVRKCLAQNRRLDSITFVSKSLLEEHGDLVEAIRAEIG
jgi:hypothetical protein